MPSYEDNANSYRDAKQSAAAKQGSEAWRISDGDARHKCRHEDYQDEGGEVNQSN